MDLLLRGDAQLKTTLHGHVCATCVLDDACIPYNSHTADMKGAFICVVLCVSINMCRMAGIQGEEAGARGKEGMWEFYTDWLCDSMFI